MLSIKLNPVGCVDGELNRPLARGDIVRPTLRTLSASSTCSLLSLFLFFVVEVICCCCCCVAVVFRSCRFLLWSLSLFLLLILLGFFVAVVAVVFVLASSQYSISMPCTLVNMCELLGTSNSAAGWNQKRLTLLKKLTTGTEYSLTSGAMNILGHTWRNTGKLHPRIIF